MLVPTNLKKGSKERVAYTERHKRAIPVEINKGPKAGLRPPGGNSQTTKDKKGGKK